MTHAPGLSAVIVDDHPVVRAGVAQWLTTGTPPIRVAASGDDVRLAWTGEGATVDVVILDLHLGGPAPAINDLRRLTEEAGRGVSFVGQLFSRGVRAWAVTVSVTGLESTCSPPMTACAVSTASPAPTAATVPSPETAATAGSELV